MFLLRKKGRIRIQDRSQRAASWRVGGGWGSAETSAPPRVTPPHPHSSHPMASGRGGIKVWPSHPKLEQPRTPHESAEVSCEPESQLASHSAPFCLLSSPPSDRCRHHPEGTVSSVRPQGAVFMTCHVGFFCQIAEVQIPVPALISQVTSANSVATLCLGLRFCTAHRGIVSTS